MITVQILNEHDNMQAKSDDDRVDLNIGVAVSLPRLVNWIKRNSKTNDTDLSASGQEVDHLLHSTSAMHVEGNVDQVLCDRLADEVPLFVCGIFQ